MKVWVVYMVKNMDYGGLGVNVTEDTLTVFDSEEKAVDYIRELIKKDHEIEDNMNPLELQYYVRFNLDQQTICEGRSIGSYRYYIKTISYKYKSYEVE